MLFTQNSFSDESIRISLPSFPPFYDEVHPSKGLIVKLIIHIEKKSGLKLIIEKLPYARILKNLRNGDLDAAIIFKNEELKDDVEYVAKLSESKVMIWTKKEYKIKDIKSLYNLQIATIRSASFSDSFDNNSKIKKIPVKNYIQALRMLDLKRVDGVVGSESGVIYSANASRINLKKFGKPLLINSKEWWLHFSKKSKKKKFIKKLKTIINSMYKKDLVSQSFKNEYF